MYLSATFFRSALCIGLISLGACSRNPVTGKREVILMSQEQEIALGQQSHPQVVSSMGLYDDKDLQAFINEKGLAMAKISHRPDLPYKFFIVDSPVVNAFAVPGGYVYFTRGIMAHFNNEAEFAGVLGHEIGHITARHGAEQQTKQLFGTLGAIGAAIFAPGLADVAQQGIGLLMLKYSRAHESQADDIGVQYSSKIGYDAHQMANFFGTIKRISDNSGQAVPNFLSTHPDPGNRYTKVHEMAKAYQAEHPAEYQVGRDRFLKMVDGIVYGEDPKQGFVENNTFYHPVLRFQFPVPSGWQYQNSPEQFQMAPKDGKSAMILMGVSGNSLDEAAQAMVKQLNLSVLQSSNTTLNGHPALLIISQQLPQQQQGQPQAASQQSQTQGQQSAQNTLQLGTYLIQYNNTIFALHGLASAADFPNKFPTFRSVADNFRSLSDPDKLNRQPVRVRIKTVPRDGTFQEAMAALGMPASRLEELGVLNSQKPGDRVSRGASVKVLTQ